MPFEQEQVHPNGDCDSSTLNSNSTAQDDSSESPLSDRQSLSNIRAFLAADKPEWMTAVDVLHVVHLMTRKGEDHPIYDSQATLAKSFAVDIKTIARSQERLVSGGLLAKPQRRGLTKALTLLYEKVPFAEPQYTRVTEAAKQLAFRYKQALAKGFQRRKFPRGWLEQQYISSQRILDRCDGDFDQAIHRLKHAANHQQHRTAVRKSMYHVLHRWPKIMATYTVAFPPAPKETA